MIGLPILLPYLWVTKVEGIFKVWVPRVIKASLVGDNLSQALQICWSLFRKRSGKDLQLQGYDNGGAEGPPTPIKSAAKGAPKMAWHPYQIGPDHLEANTMSLSSPNEQELFYWICDHCSKTSGKVFVSSHNPTEEKSIVVCHVRDHDENARFCGVRRVPVSNRSRVLETMDKPSKTRSCKRLAFSKNRSSVWTHASSWSQASLRSEGSAWNRNAARTCASSWIQASLRSEGSAWNRNAARTSASSWIQASLRSEGSAWNRNAARISASSWSQASLRSEGPVQNRSAARTHAASWSQ
jgi:hypothetical protein